MQASQKINFNQERDFGRVFGDTLKFIKQNFKSFFGNMMLIAGPFLLISGLAMAYLQSQNMGMAYMIRYGGIDYASLYITIAVAVFASIVGQAVLISYVYEYMVLYYNKPFGEKITLGEIGQRVLRGFGRVLGATLLLIVVAIPICIVIALCTVGIGSALGVAGAVIMVLMFLLGLMLLMPVVMYFFPAGYFVVVRDRINIFSALGKVRRYLKGNYWWTWLIMFLAVIALYIIQVVFTLPATIVVMAGTFSRLSNPDMEPSGPGLTLIILYTFAMFFSYISSSFMMVLCAFNFLGHEEKHEGTGLMSRIEEIK